MLGILIKMALPPTIPTSFVPRTASAANRQFSTDYFSAFKFFVFGVLGIVLVVAFGVFAYGRVLGAVKNSKDAELANAIAKIDTASVDTFVRLRNRLTSSQTLLNNHLAFSGVFSLLEKTLPATARISAMHLSQDAGGQIKFDASGIAKSFNALAAVSSAFANDGGIKDAIFSNIVVNPKDGSVAFALSAVLDPKVVAFTPTEAAAPSAVITP